MDAHMSDTIHDTELTFVFGRQIDEVWIEIAKMSYSNDGAYVLFSRLMGKWIFWYNI